MKQSYHELRTGRLCHAIWQPKRRRGRKTLPCFSSRFGSSIAFTSWHQFSKESARFFNWLSIEGSSSNVYRNLIFFFILPHGHNSSEWYRHDILFLLQEQTIAEKNKAVLQMQHCLSSSFSNSNASLSASLTCKGKKHSVSIVKDILGEWKSPSQVWWHLDSWNQDLSSHSLNWPNSIFKGSTVFEVNAGRNTLLLKLSFTEQDICDMNRQQKRQRADNSGGLLCHPTAEDKEHEEEEARHEVPCEVHLGHQITAKNCKENLCMSSNVFHNYFLTSPKNKISRYERSCTLKFREWWLSLHAFMEHTEILSEMKRKQILLILLCYFSAGLVLPLFIFR